MIKEETIQQVIGYAEEYYGPNPVLYETQWLRFRECGRVMVAELKKRGMVRPHWTESLPGFKDIPSSTRTKTLNRIVGAWWWKCHPNSFESDYRWEPTPDEAPTLEQIRDLFLDHSIKPNHQFGPKCFNDALKWLGLTRADLDCRNRRP